MLWTVLGADVVDLVRNRRPLECMLTCCYPQTPAVEACSCRMTGGTPLHSVPYSLRLEMDSAVVQLRAFFASASKLVGYGLALHVYTGV
jgi:hypothetical protein